MPFSVVRDLKERYSPLYFLAALGAGGLSVSFFVMLLFWVPHKGSPIPTFEHIATAFSSGGIPMQAFIILTMAALAAFTILHLRLLFWNVREFAQFRRTPAYEVLRNGNAETQLMTIPLTLAMTVNVLFAAGAAFVPGLWSVVEYLFPLALLAFAAIGVYAFRILTDFIGRVFVGGGFDCAKNNNLSQMLPAFALSMIAVGFAAPVAMSHNKVVVGAAFILSTFFGVSALILASIKLVLGFRGMMDQGVNKESMPTLWVVIPIVTILSIMYLRQSHGLHVMFEVQAAKSENFILMTQLLAVQLFFAMLGAAVMRRAGYFGEYIIGKGRSAASYALVCPGVALVVMGHFYVNKGLVAAGLIAKFGIVYWLLTAGLIVLQLVTIWLLFKLNAKLLKPVAGEASPAPVE